VLSGEATNTYSIVFGLTRPVSNPRSTAFEASKVTMTPPMRCVLEFWPDKNDGHWWVWPYQRETTAQKKSLILLCWVQK